MEVELDKPPSEGEVLIVTASGGFVVKGTMLEVAKRFSAEEWPTFELAESSDTVIIRSAHVVALRGGTKPARRTNIGFAPRH